MDYLNAIAANKGKERRYWSGFSVSANRRAIIACRFGVLCGIFYLIAVTATATCAEIENLVIDSSRDHLLLSVVVHDIVTGEVTVQLRLLRAAGLGIEVQRWGAGTVDRAQHRAGLLEAPGALGRVRGGRGLGPLNSNR